MEGSGFNGRIIQDKNRCENVSIIYGTLKNGMKRRKWKDNWG